MPSEQLKTLPHTGKLEFNSPDIPTEIIVSLAVGDSFHTFYTTKGTFYFINLNGKIYICQDDAQFSCVEYAASDDPELEKRVLMIKPKQKLTGEQYWPTYFKTIVVDVNELINSWSTNSVTALGELIDQMPQILEGFRELNLPEQIEVNLRQSVWDKIHSHWQIRFAFDISAYEKTIQILRNIWEGKEFTEAVISIRPDVLDLSKLQISEIRTIDPTMSEPRRIASPLARVLRRVLGGAPNIDSQETELSSLHRRNLQLQSVMNHF